MQIDLTIANQDVAGRNYLTWTPVKSTVRLLDVAGADPVNVTLSNDNPQAGGQLEFAATRDQVRAPPSDRGLRTERAGRHLSVIHPDAVGGRGGPAGRR
jgi:hypothetical protein